MAHFSRVRKADVRLPSVCRVVRRGGNGRTARFPCGWPEEHSIFRDKQCEALQWQMAAGEQLDLFNLSVGPAERNLPGGTAERVVACDTLDDDSLLAAIPGAGMRETVVLVAEAGRRRLPTAIPVLETVVPAFRWFWRRSDRARAGRRPRCDRADRRLGCGADAGSADRPAGRSGTMFAAGGCSRRTSRGQAPARYRHGPAAA